MELEKTFCASSCSGEYNAQAEYVSFVAHSRSESPSSSELGCVRAYVHGGLLFHVRLPQAFSTSKLAAQAKLLIPPH